MTTLSKPASHALTALCILSLATAACGGPGAGDAGDATTDVGPADDAAADASQGDAGPGDTGQGDGAPGDSGGDGGGAPTPRLVPASAMGHDRFFGVAYAPNGTFYAVGVVADGTDAMTDFRTLVARFTATGDLDATFGTGGFASRNLAVGTNGEVARGIVVQPSGKVVALATVEHAGGDARDRDVALVRFNTDGTVDNTFGTMGVVTLDLSTGEAVGTSFVADAAWGLTMYDDGRLLVSAAQKRTGGTDSDWAVVRLSADGARDMTFGTNGVATVDFNNRNANTRTLTLLADGSIIGAGYTDDGGVVKPILFKLTASGQLDMAFGTRGIFSQPVLAAVTEAYGAALQGTNMVTVGYGRNSAMENLDWVSLRITPAGALDTTYGTMGFARLDVMGFNDNARAMAILPDSRVLLVGGGRTAESNSDGVVAVLTANGQRDTAFGANGLRRYDLGGATDFFWGAAVSPARTHVAIVGAKGVAAGMGNDDGVVLVLPL